MEAHKRQCSQVEQIPGHNQVRPLVLDNDEEMKLPGIVCSNLLSIIIDLVELELHAAILHQVSFFNVRQNPIAVFASEFVIVITLMHILVNFCNAHLGCLLGVCIGTCGDEM